MILPLTLVVALCSSLPSIAKYCLPGHGMKILLSLFSIFCLGFSLDKALLEKPMFVQVRQFFTYKSNLSSSTVLQQDFSIGILARWDQNT